MLSTIVTARRNIGRSALAEHGATLRRVFGCCAVAILTVTLVGCEQFSGNTGTTSGTVGASAKREVQPDKTVRQAQILLADLGYDPGPADGLLGNRTTQAIREYQKAAGLPVDGKINARLMKSLGSGGPRKTQARADSSAAPRQSPGPAAAASEQRQPVNDVYSADYGDIQPIYNLGDAFVWSSGHVDTVLRVGAENVVWRSSDGTGHTAFRSFALPPLEWQTESTEGTSKIDVEPPAIWPLKIGDEIEFEVESQSRKLNEEEVREVFETWRCARGNDNTIDVPAGRFETVVVTCSRDPTPPGSWRKRVWYYAPAVRHYVRRDSFDANGQRRRIRLVSLRPAWKDWPPAARAGLDWAIQDTLTKGRNGMGVEWRSSGVSTKLMIVPGTEFTGSGERQCRKYALIQSPPMAPRVYPAISCWDADRAKWLVPGLDDAAAPVSAVR
ncbi:MAG: peptidoglycan-binding protein [Rhodospirillales bacterium]|nr:MAG: peptidoglycan-binding protein [Rhodospirillales bacterium]